MQKRIKGILAGIASLLNERIETRKRFSLVVFENGKAREATT